MTEESKQEETLHIEISQFSNSPRRSKEAKRSSKEKENEISPDNTMKIMIETKNKKKSVISLNVNDIPSSSSDREGDNYQIKIEKRKNGKSSSTRGSKYSSQDQKKMLSDNNSNQEMERRDIFGNLIQKGKHKKHKISFIDLIKDMDQIPTEYKNKNFIDIVHIESFKNFNVDMSQPMSSSNGKTDTCCGKICLIF